MRKSCDITAELSAEAILSSTSEPVICVDHRGTILEFNPAAERALNLLRTEVLGQNVTRFIPGKVAQLEQAIGELESFSYSLSHDMRAPLRAIRNFTELVLMEHEEKIGYPGADYLKTVMRSAERLDRLAQDVLSLTRLTRRDIRLEAVNVEHLIRGLISERPDLQPPAAEVVIERPLLHVTGNEASLVQCLANLLGNAIKYVSPGTTPRIRIRSERAGANVRLWVEDNGIGIEKEAHARIFELFQRHGNSKGYEGSGLGLAIVRKAVERMGGRVGVESELGKGSRFWIELPPARGAEQVQLPL